MTDEKALSDLGARWADFMRRTAEHLAAYVQSCEGWDPPSEIEAKNLHVLALELEPYVIRVTSARHESTCFEAGALAVDACPECNLGRNELDDGGD